MTAKDINISGSMWLHHDKPNKDLAFMTLAIGLVSIGWSDIPSRFPARIVLWNCFPLTRKARERRSRRNLPIFSA